MSLQVWIPFNKQDGSKDFNQGILAKSPWLFESENLLAADTYHIANRFGYPLHLTGDDGYIYNLRNRTDVDILASEGIEQIYHTDNFTWSVWMNPDNVVGDASYVFSVGCTDMGSGGYGLQFQQWSNGDGEYYIDQNICTDCGSCFNACPIDAIDTWDGGDHFSIDENICTQCGLCYEPNFECPVRAIKVSSSKGYQLIIYFGTGTDSDNHRQFISITPGWHHLAFTKKGTNCKVYLDGAVVRDYEFNGSLPTYTEADGLGVGCFTYEFGNLYPFSGDIYDFRIYDEVLSPEEIKRLYWGLVAHYTFDDISLSTIKFRQLVFNGDFKDTTFWQFTTDNITGDSIYPDWNWGGMNHSATTIYNGTLTFKGANYYGSEGYVIKYNYNFKPSHKYCFRCQYRYNEYRGTTLIWEGKHTESGSGLYSKNIPISYIWTDFIYNFTAMPDKAGTMFQIFGSSTAQDAYDFSIRNCMLFDLTEIYGVGNEPTGDDFVKAFPASYYSYVPESGESRWIPIGGGFDSSNTPINDWDVYLDSAVSYDEYGGIIVSTIARVDKSIGSNPAYGIMFYKKCGDLGLKNGDVVTFEFKMAETGVEPHFDLPFSFANIFLSSNSEFRSDQVVSIGEAAPFVKSYYGPECNCLAPTTGGGSKIYNYLTYDLTIRLEGIDENTYIGLNIDPGATSISITDAGIGTECIIREPRLIIQRDGGGKLYDCSGMGNGGEIGDGQPIVIADSPRYERSTNINNSSILLSNDLSSCLDRTMTYNIGGGHDSISSPINGCPFSISFWYKSLYGTIFETSDGLIISKEPPSQSWSIFIPNLIQVGLIHLGQKYTASISDAIISTLIDTIDKHMVFTYDGTNVSIYCNGINLSVTSSTGNAFVNEITKIGSSLTSGGISDFRIYNSVLSANDVMELYNTKAMISNEGTLMAESFNEPMRTMVKVLYASDMYNGYRHIDDEQYYILAGTFNMNGIDYYKWLQKDSYSGKDIEEFYLLTTSTEFPGLPLIEDYNDNSTILYDPIGCVSIDNFLGDFNYDRIRKICAVDYIDIAGICDSKIMKNSVIQSSTFVELPYAATIGVGEYYITDVFVPAGSHIKVTTVIQYLGGSGRDLMGFSSAGTGYWGVTDGGQWEHHWSTSTSNDITAINTVVYDNPNTNNEVGYYQIGALVGSYSTRSKRIYSVRIEINDVLVGVFVPLPYTNDILGGYNIVNLITGYNCEYHTTTAYMLLSQPTRLNDGTCIYDNMITSPKIKEI